MFYLFDTHCHLQDKRLNGLRKSMIKRAEDAGVRNMLCCGTRESDWENVLHLSRQFESVLPAIGIHPWFIDSSGDNWQSDMENLVKRHPVAIGEIGLDFLVKDVCRTDQEKIFIYQLNLAKKYKRAVSVHCRKAWQRMTDILKHENMEDHTVVIHSYSGSAEMVDVLEKMGCYLSFSGSVTKTHNKRVKKALMRVSPDRLLIETDSPDIQPEGYEKQLNEPSHLQIILSEISKLRGIPKEKLSRLIYENSMKVFGSKG